MRFRSKRILLDAFSPIVLTTTIENAERFHRKRIHLKTLSRVETFENGAKRKRINVDGENAAKTIV